MAKGLTQVSDAIRSGQRFLVAAHYSPDGDAIGSTFALGHMLTALGKDVRLYNISGTPEHYDWLSAPVPLEDQIPDETFDWIIALDCGDKARLGDELAPRFEAEGTICIDHHLGNPGFAQINWVDTTCSSVGEMIARLAMALDVPLAGDLGECVYVAVVTDTGYFSYGNTSPATLELAAELLRQGLEPAEVNNKLQNQWSRGRLKLWSRVLDSAEFFYDGRIGVIRITSSLFEETGTTSADTEGLVNYVLRVKSVKVAICLREDDENNTKISLRSSGPVNVQVIAAEFSGGGHKNASGCAILADMDEAQRQLLDVAGRFLGYK